MHFNGLIRKFSGLSALDASPEFTTAQAALLAQVQQHVDGFHTQVPVFKDSHWRIMYREPALLPPVTPTFLTLDKTTNDALEAFIRLIHPVFNAPHRLVFSQLLWMKPGESVDTHVDLQRAFTFTKRFNIVLAADGLSYSVFKGNTAVEIPLVDGDIFELNNRARHHSSNVGTGVVAILVLDFVERSVPAITEEQRTTPAPVTAEESTADSPIVITDY